MSYPGRKIFIQQWYLGWETWTIFDGFPDMLLIRLIADMERVRHFLSLAWDRKGRTPRILVGNLSVLHYTVVFRSVRYRCFSTSHVPLRSANNPERKISDQTGSESARISSYSVAKNRRTPKLAGKDAYTTLYLPDIIGTWYDTPVLRSGNMLFRMDTFVPVHHTVHRDSVRSR